MKLKRGKSVPHEKYLPRFEVHIRFENTWGDDSQLIEWSFPTMKEMLAWVKKVQDMNDDEKESYFRFETDKSYREMSFYEYTKDNICYELDT